MDPLVLHLVSHINQEDLNFLFRPVETFGKGRHGPALDSLKIVLKRPYSQGFVVRVSGPRVHRPLVLGQYDIDESDFCHDFGQVRDAREWTSKNGAGLLYKLAASDNCGIRLQGTVVRLRKEVRFLQFEISVGCKVTVDLVKGRSPAGQVTELTQSTVECRPSSCRYSMSSFCCGCSRMACCTSRSRRCHQSQTTRWGGRW